MPLEKIDELSKLQDKEINKAKIVLAYEVTKLIHGEDEANKAKSAAEALFADGKDSSDMPTLFIDLDVINSNILVLDLLADLKIIPSKAEGKRLISQGGLYISDERVEGFEHIISKNDFVDNHIIVRKGKKSFYKIQIKA